jgi:uncharacterized membrane protein YkvI
MRKKWVLILQIAATYVGTVIGAGFASGQSIMQFFTVYGSLGAVGCLISTFLFMWIGTKMMLISHRIKAFSYQDLNYHLFGNFFGKAANILTFIILFGVTAVMLSGTGSIFEEQLGMPYQVGIIVSIVFSYLVMTRGMNGILAVNSLVVPLMLCFSIFIAFQLVDINGLMQTTGWQRHQLEDFNWLVSPFTYAALNFAFVQAVMVPLASEVEDESVLRWGGIWGGIGLGFMLLVSHLAMNSEMPEIIGYEIPMGEFIRYYGWYIHVLFLLVVYGEIFTTLIGNVFGLTRQIQSIYNIPRNYLVLIILLATFLISQVGFASLLTYLYPLFGYLGMILLVFLAIKRLPNERK